MSEVRTERPVARSEQITNPFMLISRMQWGWSAAQCIGAIRSLSSDEAARWYHTIIGAEVAWQSVQLFGLAATAKVVMRWLEDQSAKESGNESAA